ncbi:hypothetical protein MCETRE41_01157 [Candidatus Methylopumilus universalis]
MINNVIIVNTCDAYSDIWALFFKAFDEYWPRCEYRIILNTEKINELPQGIANKNITIHNFKKENKPDQWGLRLKETIQSTDSRFITLLFDDFILEKSVRQNQIKKCINWLNDNPEIAAFYLKHIPVNKNIEFPKFKGFELIPKRGDYKLNSAPSVWRREKLMKYLNDDDNPWAWEYFGTFRTYKNKDLFFCLDKKNQPIYHYNDSMGGAIYRGKWVGKVILPLLKKYKISLDTKKRGIVEGPEKSKRTLLWRIKFFYLGFKMIKFGVFIFLYRILKNKLKQSVTP